MTEEIYTGYYGVKKRIFPFDEMPTVHVPRDSLPLAALTDRYIIFEIVFGYSVVSETVSRDHPSRNVYH